MLRIACILCALGTSTVALADELPTLKLTEPALLQADDGGGEGAHGSGSLLAGRTVGAGADVIHAQFGWPGVFIGYLHGQSQNLDVGGTFGFVYGAEWTTHVNPGLKLAGAFRLSFVDNGKINVGIRFDPGLNMYFRDQFMFGIAMPIALAIGVSAGDAIMINFGLRMPMGIFFVPDFLFTLPILTGVGVEYHVDSHISVTLNTGFGPEIEAVSRGSTTEFAFETLAGIGYRL